MSLAWVAITLSCSFRSVHAAFPMKLKKDCSIHHLPITSVLSQK